MAAHCAAPRRPSSNSTMSCRTRTVELRPCETSSCDAGRTISTRPCFSLAMVVMPLDRSGSRGEGPGATQPRGTTGVARPLIASAGRSDGASHLSRNKHSRVHSHRRMGSTRARLTSAAMPSRCSSRENTSRIENKRPPVQLNSLVQLVTALPRRNPRSARCHSRPSRLPLRRPHGRHAHVLKCGPE